MRDVLTAIIGAIAGAVVSGVIAYLLARWQIARGKEGPPPTEPVSLRAEFDMTEILANSIRKKSFTPDLIVCVAPGGNMIGEWLSRRFLGDRSKPVPVCSLWLEAVRDTDGRIKSIPEAEAILTPPSRDIKRILLVNDISRTGNSLSQATEFVRRKFPPPAVVKTAVLFWSKEASLESPDFCVEQPIRMVVFEWKK